MQENADERSLRLELSTDETIDSIFGSEIAA